MSQTWVDQARAARDAGATWFCFLDATDDIGREDTITLTLRLVDPRSGVATTLATALDRGAPSVASLASLWPAAAGAERAVAESFGVEFVGGDPRPLLHHDRPQPPPLRKDVLLPARQDRVWPGSRGGEETRTRRRDTPPGVADATASDVERVLQAHGGGRGRR